VIERTLRCPGSRPASGDGRGERSAKRHTLKEKSDSLFQKEIWVSRQLYDWGEKPDQLQ